MTPDPFDQAHKLLQVHSAWVVGVVDTQIFWPSRAQAIQFNDKTFILLPPEQIERPRMSVNPGIAIDREAFKLTVDAARHEILQLATALCWHENKKLEITGWTGGNLPRSTATALNTVRTDYLDVEQLELPPNDAAATALAFYREGVSLDNPFYAFLSLYKAFSVALPAPKTRRAWIAAARERIDERDAVNRLQELERDGHEVSEYIYQDCRNAIAHADTNIFVNPDRLDDKARLLRDLPLMRNFVEVALEERFRIKRSQRLYQEHLYELAGFRRVIGSEAIYALERSDIAGTEIAALLPRAIALIARRGYTEASFPDMAIIRSKRVAEGLTITFRSRGSIVRTSVTLGFRHERLFFDPIRDLSIDHDPSSKEKLVEELQAVECQRMILTNGHIEIWDVEKCSRLGRSETYIPFNMRIDVDDFKEREAELKRLMDKV